MPESDAKSELTPQDVGKRVAAARALRGFRKRTDLAKAMEEKELPPSRLARIERGEAKLLAPYREKLAAFLHLPEEWFTEAEENLWHGPQEDRLTRIEEALVKIEGKLNRPDPLRHLGGGGPAPPQAPPDNDESAPSRQTPQEEGERSGEERP